MPFLAWTMQNRGKDGWGATDGDKIVKHITPTTKSFAFSEIAGMERLICHTRGASVGAVSIPNQHPFEFARAGGQRVIGVHNGHINNHADLNRQYNRNFEVDSMHVYAHIAADLPLTELEGWGNLAYFDGGGMRFAMLNSDDLHFAKLASGPMVFASTRECIEIACRMLDIQIECWYETEQDRMYDLYDDILHVGEEVKISVPRKAASGWDSSFGQAAFRNWGTSSATSTRSRTQEFANIGSFSRSKGTCFKCSVATVDRRKATLCGECVNKLLKDIVSGSREYKVYA